jgi:hypothetical protein
MLFPDIDFETFRVIYRFYKPISRRYKKHEIDLMYITMKLPLYKYLIDLRANTK